VGWVWSRIARPRPGLAILAAVFLVLGVIYSVITPIFETPDEPQHFFYAQRLATARELPIQDASNPGPWLQEGSQPPLYYALVALLIAPLDTRDAASLLWLNPHANLGDPLYPANKNRIVHTEREAWPYCGTTLAVHLARWLSVLLGAGSICLTYLIVSRLLPGRPALALATAGLMACTPQFIFISAAVSNDNLITFLAALSIWLLLRVVQTPSPGIGRDDMLLGLVLGLAALTKLSGLTLWLLSGVTLLITQIRLFGYWSPRAQDSRATVIRLAVIFGTALLVAGWWYLRNWQLYGDPTGLNRMLDIVGRRATPLGWREILSQFQGLRISYWALFGWFNLLLPDWVYKTLDGFALLAALGLGLGWVSGALPRSRALLLPAGWSGLLLLSLVRWTQITPGTQGRLLFPAAWAINLFLMLGWAQWAALVPRATQRLRKPSDLVPPSNWRRAWSAIPVVALAIAAIVSPFAVIRPAYLRPSVWPIEDAPALPRLGPWLHGEHAAIIGGRLEPEAARPGDTVWVAIHWQVLQPFDRDYTVFVHLLDHLGQSLAEANSWPGLGAYPTRLWQPATTIADRYPVVIPHDVVAPALLRAEVGFFAPETGEGLPSRSADGRPASSIVGSLRLLPRQPAQSQPAFRTPARLGDRIRLLGYDLTPAGPIAPGKRLTLTLYWQADDRAIEDYTVMLHLLGPGDAIAAQGDGPPRAGAWPTSAWEPGQPVTDHRTLVIPPNAAAGRYEVWVGLYGLSATGSAGDRLPIAEASGRVRDNALLLGAIAVAHE